MLTQGLHPGLYSLRRYAARMAPARFCCNPFILPLP